MTKLVDSVAKETTAEMILQNAGIADIINSLIEEGFVGDEQEAVTVISSALRKVFA